MINSNNSNNFSKQGTDSNCSGSIANDVTVQGSQLQEISDLIATIKGKVESLTARMSQAELNIDALEQYSRFNCLILHGSKFLGSNSQHSSNQEPKHFPETVSNHGRKTRGNTSRPTFLPGRDTIAFVPPNFCTIQSQSSEIKFSSFIFSTT